jgi:hypothetical protein
MTSAADTDMLLLAVMLLQVGEYSRNQREKMQRRGANAKEGAFEWDTIKREVDDVRIPIRAPRARTARPARAELARAVDEC